ncbi:MAG: flagellar filament capping protein FliD [Planctomycetota bacterium]|nr:flagellar filament capping protein FliD [Planctomycetota bacterium]
MGSIPSGYGLISGFDTATLVERMLSFHAQGRARLESRVGLMQARRSALLDINAGLLAAANTTASLSSANIFQAVSASSSHPSLLNAVADSNASPGIYQFIVAGLATHHQLLSGGFSSDASALGLEGATIELGNGGLTQDMPLSWLNGGEGIQRGMVELVRSDTGESAAIDLEDVTTLDEVIERLADNALGITATLQNGGIVLTSSEGFDFSVAEVGGAQTAGDLGIQGTSVNGELAGAALAQLGGGLSLAALNDGNGVLVREGLADIRIKTHDGRVFDVDLSSGTLVALDDETLLSAFNGGTGVSIDDDADDPDLTIELVDGETGGTTSWDIDLTGCVTTGDVRNRVAAATGGSVTLSYRADGHGFQVTPLNAADRVSVHGAGTLGDTTAEDLGILNASGAIGGFEGSDVSAVGGGSIPTVQGVLDAINAAIDQNGQANDGAVIARMASDGLRLELQDLTTGGNAFTIDSTSANASAVDALGFGEAVEANDLLTGSRIVGSPGTVLVRELFGGTGLAGADSLTVTDRFGMTASISGLAQYETVEELVSGIQGWFEQEGLQLKLEVQGNRVVLSDRGGSGSLVVSGDLAERFGLTVDAIVSSVSSDNLQHRWIANATLLDDLNQGRGIGTGSFRLRDATGATSTVTLSAGHQTVQDVIDLINSRGLAIQARINDNGDGLLLESTADESQAVVEMQVETISGTAAADLRLIGESMTAIDGSWETTLSVDGQTTLRQLADMINESDVSAIASLVSTGDPGSPWRLSLTSDVSGAAGRMLVDLEGLDVEFEEVIAARDARIVLGDDVASGVMITSGFNQLNDVIAGLTLDLLEVSDEIVTVTVERDETQATEAVRAMIEALNGVLDRIDLVNGYDPETAERGVLHGDSTVSRIRRMLLTAIQQAASSEDLGMDGLWSVGIRVGAGGRIEFDEATFAEAWATRREDVEALFTTNANGVEGFGVRLESMLNQLTSTDGGTLSLADASWEGRIEVALDRLVVLDARMESRRIQLVAQFTAMEEVLASMQSQSLALLSFGSSNSGFGGLLG